MKVKRMIAMAAAALACGVSAMPAAADAAAVINVSPGETVHPVSPYIYGVNIGVDLPSVSAKSLRLGGNRLTAYNWENNLSNAGSDYNNITDNYLLSYVAKEFQIVPGGPALAMVNDAKTYNIPYKLATLQMQGYVSSNKQGQVNVKNFAPSENWFKVENHKNAPYELKPDKKADEVVYMDEYVNYLVETLGGADSTVGISAYSLDNEPALWKSTHSLIQTEPLKAKDLVDKTIDLAGVVKSIDPAADVFGPALFGYSAFVDLAGAPDWSSIKTEGGYDWFVDYYLDAVKKASDEAGVRLVDVLDVHYYTEAKGVCGTRSCNHYDDDGCIAARLNGVRSLYDPDYKENSWITDTGAKFFPLIPFLQNSVDKYYSGTKIAFTEYNFGGGDHISGGVAQADFLGTLANYGIFGANLWSFEHNEYILGAINMFTNFDGSGTGFGDTLVKSDSNSGDVLTYAAVNTEDPGTVTVIMTNHSIHESTPVTVNLSGETAYDNADVFSLYGDSTASRPMPGITGITNNSFSYTLEPLSVTVFNVKTPEPQAIPAEATLSDIPETPSEPTEEGSHPLTTVANAAIIAGAALVIAALAAVIIKLKKSK
jgi:hypothetical protein